MLDGVPHAYRVERVFDRVLEKISRGDRNANGLARVSRSLARNVDATHAMEVPPREIQKEAVCRADFEQAIAAAGRYITQQGIEAALELLVEERAFGNIIPIFVAVKIRRAVQVFEFFAR